MTSIWPLSFCLSADAKALAWGKLLPVVKMTYAVRQINLKAVILRDPKRGKGITISLWVNHDLPEIL